MKPLISVIVCTYNRSEILNQCLNSLVRQSGDKALYEVVVVNNNSTDNTQSVVESYAREHSNMRLILETMQGLSHARNRGWQEAKGEYIAYIDDDAKAYADWIAQMAQFIDRHPEIKVFGGPYYPFSTVDIPKWFPPEYGRHSLGDNERLVNYGPEWITGSNMVLHRQIFIDFGGFDPNLGMKGKKMSYGEETKFFLNLSRHGVKIYYVPCMKVEHLIAAYKLSLKWLLLSNFSAGRVSARTSGIVNPPKYLLKELYNALKSGVRTFMTTDKGIPLKRRVFYAGKNVFYKSGTVIERLFYIKK